ncbi:MAG: hypothetical protein MK105_17940 [Crocinitomicaceae bacterium]|nr:hypothetical protein [Crocinitomicaceae bacterium]
MIFSWNLGVPRVVLGGGGGGVVSEILMIILGGTIPLTILIYVGYRKSKIFGVINLLLALLYNVSFTYNLIYHGHGGSSLVWIFYLAIFTLAQILFILIYLLVKYLTRKNSKDEMN